MNIFRNIILCFLFNSFILAQCDSYSLGDANSDNVLDIIDVVIIVDAIFGYVINREVKSFVEWLVDLESGEYL